MKTKLALLVLCLAVCQGYSQGLIKFDFGMPDADVYNGGQGNNFAFDVINDGGVILSYIFDDGTIVSPAGTLIASIDGQQSWQVVAHNSDNPNGFDFSVTPQQVASSGFYFYYSSPDGNQFGPIDLTGFDATKGGTLSYNAQGGFPTFTPAAVPEPSTNVFFCLGAGLLILLSLRRALKIQSLRQVSFSSDLPDCSSSLAISKRSYVNVTKTDFLKSSKILSVA